METCATLKTNKSLALCGGPKVLSIPGPHYKWPRITPSIEQAVIAQLHNAISIYDRSGIFAEFEEQFASMHQRKHALLFSSGTVAIHAMYVAAGLGPDDEVICPAYTFFATVTPLLFTGAKPVLCDCDDNGNIDPEEIRRKVTLRTKAVVVTHMWGTPCQMDRIVAICKEHGLLLMEDCSHAHGAVYQGVPVGAFGDLAAWSLQGPKNITGGEGGILVTSNADYYYRALLLGHYNKRCKQEIPKTHSLAKFATTGMGLKYRAHPIAIAIAAHMLKDLPRALRNRDAVATRLSDALQGMTALRSLTRAPGVQPSWYAYVLRYDSAQLGHLPLPNLISALHAEGLLEVDHPSSTSPLNLLPLFQDPTPLFPAYRDNPFTYAPGDFPRAEQFFRSAIKLPVWAYEDESDIVRAYIDGIVKVITNYRELI